MTTNEGTSEYHFSGYRLETTQRRLFNPAGELVNLNARAFDSLLMLVEHHGQTLSKAQMMEAVWPNSIVEENNLNQAIYCLRKALGDSRSGSAFIMTISGRGYCFVAPVELRPTSGPADNAATTAPAAAATAAALPAAAAGNGHVRWHFRPTGITPLFGALIFFMIAGAGLYLFREDILRGTQPGAESVAAPLTAANPQTDTIANSIAVLPFTNLNPDAAMATDNELFALGLHDEVTNELSKLENFKVIDRTRVLALAGQDLTIAEMARQLRVASMVSGTILVQGDNARINLQMLDAATGVTLWADTYEAAKDDLSEMISMQTDIAQHVAATLKAEAEQPEQEKIAARPTKSPDAYRYHLAAKIAHSSQEYQREWHLSRQALVLDPDYLDALYTFAHINTVLAATPLPGMTSSEHIALALENTERLIALAPERSQGYTLKAMLLGMNSDWLGVSTVLEQLDGMNVPTAELKHISLLLMGIGDFDRAVHIAQKILDTEPMNLGSRGFLMAAHELTDNVEAARRKYEMGEQLRPAWFGDTVNIFLALGRGQPLEDVDELAGISDELKFLLLNVHDVDLVNRKLQTFGDSTAKGALETMFYAAIAAHAGENARSVELMRSSLAEIGTGMFWVWLPVFDEARRLESFRQLLRDSGVVAYWQQNGWPEVCRPDGESFDCNWKARVDLSYN